MNMAPLVSSSQISWPEIYPIASSHFLEVIGWNVTEGLGRTRPIPRPLASLFRSSARPYMRFGSRDHSEFSPRLAMVDCKTVRIFAYSSTREQSNKRSGMRLKTESETGERRFARVRLLRHALPISLLILRKKPTVLQSTPWSLVENNKPTDRNEQVVQTLDSTIHYRTNHYLADSITLKGLNPRVIP